MEELKPCPFCGGTKLKIDSKTSGRKHYTDSIHNYTQTYSVSVRCNTCHARGGVITVEVQSRKFDEAFSIANPKAAEAWNRRL